MDNAQILYRPLTSLPLRNAQGQPAGALLAALSMQGPGGAMARLYFAPGTDPALMPQDGAPGVALSRIVAGAGVTELLVPPDSARLALPLPGAASGVELITPEPELFAGQNALMGLCNGESPEVIRDWLIWHIHKHRAEAALIIDRGTPEQTRALIAAFTPVWQRAVAESPDLGAIRIVVTGFDLPLGQAEHGPEEHPLYAPDAPGKDRMEAPDPAPWRSPLGYRLLFDLMRELFLSRARAVANIELYDLIQPLPDAEGGIFDRAVNSADGVVPLALTRIYPWGLRKGREAGFGDHICRRFDGGSHIGRWCAAPARLPQGAIWMMVRILGVKTEAPAADVWRCAAIRHGDDDKVSRIVPRSSLIEDDSLLALADHFGTDPVRMPEGVAGAGLPADTSTLGNRVAIVTTMKNEGPFILEWIAYHRAIGVENILVFTNDCNDGTDSFLQLLERKGYCQWRENPYREVNMKPQHAALDAADSEPLLREADWAICMDVDEYIAVHIGDGTLKALFDRVPQANMISLTWRLFGNSDIDVYEDGFITQDYTRCAREFANKPHQAWGFKTLYRNIGLFKKMGVHRPKGLQPNAVDYINWVNGSGKQMPQDQWRNAWRSHSGTYGYDLVSLNHYAVRSAESFLVKRDRGRVNHVDRDQGMAYWFRMNHNVVEDDRMRRILPLLQAEVDRMLADPEIRAAHEGCVAAHKARIEELKAQPKYQEFHRELNSARTRKLSRLHGHFGANVYLAGPQVVPDEIVANDPEDDWFFTVDHVGEAEH